MPVTLLHRLIPLIVAIHRCISCSDLATRTYFLLLSRLVRPMADSLWKHRLLNVLNQTAWPHVSLPPKVVLVGGQTPLRLIPHVGEFDFAALFFRALTYEPEVFKELGRRLGDFQVVIEIGSNVGIFTLFIPLEARRQGHRVEVFAFEPAREAFARLSSNLEANGLVEVNAFRCAVSDTTGFVPFFEPAGHLTNGSLLGEFAGLFSTDIQQSTVMTISSELLAPLIGEGQRALLKIDVEGASAQVLAAMRPVIENTLPEIIIEVLCIEEAGLNALHWLHERYEFYLITSVGLIARDSFVASESHRDFWLKPRS